MRRGGQMWLKRVLIPFWVIQLLGFLLIVGSGAYSLYYLEEYFADDTYYNDIHTYYGSMRIGVALLISFASLCTIFDIIEIVFFARKKLSPVYMVVDNCIKFVIWSIYFIGALLAWASSGAAFIVSIILVSVSLGELIYASVILHRHRKGRLGYSSARAEYGEEHSPPPRGSYAGYNPGGASMEPMRSPFRDPSPAPTQHSAQDPTATHPAYRADGTHDYELQGQGRPY